MLSPRSGFSIFQTSAPMSPSSVVHQGPAAWWLRSMTRMPASGPVLSMCESSLPSACGERTRRVTPLLQQGDIHLVHRVARQAVDEFNLPRFLEGGEPAPGEIGKRCLIGPRAGTWHDHGRDLLTPFGMRCSDDRDVGDIRVRP